MSQVGPTARVSRRNSVHRLVDDTVDQTVMLPRCICRCRSLTQRSYMRKSGTLSVSASDRERATSSISFVHSKAKDKPEEVSHPSPLFRISKPAHSFRDFGSA